MTRKRISEGLIESLSTVCEVCNGRGIVLDRRLCRPAQARRAALARTGARRTRAGGPPPGR